MDEKVVRIVPDSVSRLINGTGKNGQPAVAEIHAGLEPEDVLAIQAGEAELVTAIIENGEGIIPPHVHDDGPQFPTGDDKNDIDIPRSPIDGNGIPTGRPIPPIDGDDHIIDDPIPFDGVGSDYAPTGDNLPETDTFPEQDSESSPDHVQDDDDDKRTILGIPIPISLLGLGATLGLSLLLSQCNGLSIPQIDNPFIDVHKEHHIQQSNVHQVAEVADLYFESDEYLRGSQVRSPGELIDEVRNAGGFEALGREEGREKYDSMGDDARVSKEKLIQEINRLFNEQTQIIQDNRSIIEDSSKSPEEKENAIKAIQKAKVAQSTLYSEFSPLFEQYYEEAVATVSNPADDRTDSEVNEYAGIYAQYQDGKENLHRDADRISGIVETYLNPERYEDQFFEETPEQAYNAEDKGPVDNTLDAIGPCGHREVTESEVTSQLDANPNSAGQVHEGLIDVTQARKVTVDETRIGISALLHRIGDFFNELGNNFSERFNSFIENNDQQDQSQINNDQQNPSPSNNKDFEDEER